MLVALLPKTSTVLLSDLSEQVTKYNLLGLEDGYLDPYDEEVLVAVRLNQRLKHCAKIVLQWGIEGAWHLGEGWIGDVLAAVIAGTGIFSVSLLRVWAA